MQVERGGCLGKKKGTEEDEEQCSEGYKQFHTYV